MDHDIIISPENQNTIQALTLTEMALCDKAIQSVRNGDIPLGNGYIFTDGKERLNGATLGEMLYKDLLETVEFPISEHSLKFVIAERIKDYKAVETLYPTM